MERVRNTAHDEDFFHYLEGYLEQVIKTVIQNDGEVSGIEGRLRSFSLYA